MIYSLLAITTFVFTCINFSYAQHTSEVNAEIFFLDLGIVIEPARGNEKYSRLVKATSKEGDLVLDPFCGSGSTGEMALKLGRRFVGYELNPQFCTLSELRLSKIKEVII